MVCDTCCCESSSEKNKYTCRGLREEAGLEGREPKQLVYARPDDDLLKVVGTLFQNKCSMAPILSSESGASGHEVCMQMLAC